MIAVYKPIRVSCCVGCHEKPILRVDSGLRKEAVWTAHFCRDCAADYARKILHALAFDFSEES